MQQHYCLDYEHDYFIIINDISHEYYYYFDYGERSYSINMEFEHLHPFYEIMILISPQAQHFIAGVPYDISAGDMVLLPPSVLHKSVYPKGPASKRLIIDFLLPRNMFQLPEAYKPLLQTFYREIPVFRFPEEQRQILYQNLNEVFALAHSPFYKERPQDHMMVHMHFMKFLYQLHDMQASNIYVPHQHTPVRDSKIYDITSYIHSHYQEELSLSLLAERFYLSPCYLSHQFKKVTGFTITKYIQTTRIKNARYFLQTSEFHISEIAQKCGFQSFSQFNRIFRQECGMAPSEFRKIQHSWLNRT